MCMSGKWWAEDHHGVILVGLEDMNGQGKDNRRDGADSTAP